MNRSGDGSPKWKNVIAKVRENQDDMLHLSFKQDGVVVHQTVITPHTEKLMMFYLSQYHGDLDERFYCHTAIKEWTIVQGLCLTEEDMENDDTVIYCVQSVVDQYLESCRSDPCRLPRWMMVLLQEHFENPFMVANRSYSSLEDVLETEVNDGTDLYIESASTGNKLWPGSN